MFKKAVAVLQQRQASGKDSKQLRRDVQVSLVQARVKGQRLLQIGICHFKEKVNLLYIIRLS